MKRKHFKKRSYILIDNEIRSLICSLGTEPSERFYFWVFVKKSASDFAWGSVGTSVWQPVINSVQNSTRELVFSSLRRHFSK